MILAQLALFSFFDGMSETVVVPGTFDGYIAWGPLTFFDGFTESGAPPPGGVERTWRRKQLWHRSSS